MTPVDRERNSVPPWAHGAFELIEEGQRQAAAGTDLGKRQALICFDNAIEVSIRIFVDVDPRMRDGYIIPKERADQARGAFPSKMLFLDWYLTDRNLDAGVPVTEIQWHHQLRNDLYHSGNGLVPEDRRIDRAMTCARGVFRVLFGEPAAAGLEPQIDPPSAGEVKRSTPGRAATAQRPSARKGDAFGVGRVQATWPDGFLVTSDAPKGMYGNEGRRGGPGVGCGCPDPYPRRLAPDPSRPDDLVDVHYQNSRLIPAPLQRDATAGADLRSMQSSHGVGADLVGLR